MIIKVTPDGTMTEHSFPTGSIDEINDALSNLIGADCETYEVVCPVRLYTELNHKKEITNTPGEAVAMLVDEEGLVKNEPLPINPIATLLYNPEDTCHSQIAGTALFVGLCYSEEGPEFCGIDKDVKDVLWSQLKIIKHKTIKLI